MTIARELVYAALYAKVQALQGAGVFKTVGRRLYHWSDVAPELHPACYLAQERETAVTNASGIPLHYRLHCSIYVYVWQANVGQAPAPALNVCLDAIETALKAAPGREVQDLGYPDRVRHCFVDGEIVTDEGTLGDRAVAIVPIVIVVA